MDIEKFRQEMNNFRQRVTAEAIENKAAAESSIKLDKLYSRFNEDERNMANQVLIEWLQSSESSTRNHALYLIKKHKIRVTCDALKTFANRISALSHPTAPEQYELKYVQSILEIIE